MPASILLRFCTALALLASSLTNSATDASSYSEAAQELLQVLVAKDPSISSQPQEWAKRREALLTASLEAKSLAGLKLSWTRILESWPGKSFRFLDQADLQYWALEQAEQDFPDAGAIFQARGAKWSVQYPSQHGIKIFRRGDEVKTAGFDPIQSFLGPGPISLEVQSSPISKVRSLSIKSAVKPFAAYTLAETQASDRILLRSGKRICLQKLWFWLNEAVTQHLQSKLKFYQENCAAQLIDLRDGFGALGSIQLGKSKKIPTIVLVNQESREGAVRLAEILRQEWQAKLLGEVTRSSQLPEAKQKLKTLPWTLLIYSKQGPSLVPDIEHRDSWLYAEGVDTSFEAALNQLEQGLK